MSTRKYILKRQDLYNETKSDFIVENNTQRKQNKLNSNAQNKIEKEYPKNISFNLVHPSGKEIEQANKLGYQIKNQPLEIIQKSGSKTEQIKQMLILHKNSFKEDKTLKQKVINQAPTKRLNVSIGFSSSLNKNNHVKNQVIKSNTNKSKSKQKTAVMQNKTKDKSIQKLNFSQSINLTARSASGKKKIIKQKQIDQNTLQKPNLVQDSNDKGQCLQIDSILSSSIQNTSRELNKMQQNMTIKKQKQPLMQQNYLKQIDSQLHYLQTELRNHQSKNKQLEQILTTRQSKLDEQQRESIRLYKQNKDLSDMFRDLQQIMHKKSIQYEKSLLQFTTKQKQKDDKYKILQAERDTLLRKIDRLKQEIQKLYEVIKIKDTQILSQKQKEQFLISQNKELIIAYENMKHELQQVLKINETSRFMKQLVEKGEQQTARNNLQVSTFKCSKCHQVIYGNENTMDELAKYHLNQKFKNHIKTYEEEVKYWKDEINFMKTQHQHQIENIRTVLQCTFQKNLIDKQTKYNHEINEMKKTILIQQELITNYKNTIKRKNKVLLKENQQGMKSIDSKRNASFRLENVQTARSRSYLTDRKVIEEVLAEEQENRPRQNKSIIRMKQNHSALKDSLLNSSRFLEDGDKSILQSFKRKVQISDQKLNSKITNCIQDNERLPLSELK